MDSDIKTIEDLSLNAWPSHQMEVFDGWILRFSYFYTHRTNCVEQIGMSVLPLEEKTEYCEKIYARWKTPCIFKISPVTDPAMDWLLEKRGYAIEHPVDVMTMDIENENLFADAADPARLHVSSRVDRKWLNGLFDLKNLSNPVHRKIVPSMYAAIPKDEIAVYYESGGKIAATGLGILDRNFIGIYAIHVSEELRRKGIAESILHTLLSEGKRQGAKKAYLQVVSDNAPAKALYRKLGFTAMYSCWFRVKEV